MNTTLLPSVERLAQVRAQLAETQALVKSRKEEFERSIAPLVEAQKDLAATVATAEEGLRAQALAVYRESNDRKPVAGVEIKTSKTLAYDEKDAFAWGKKAEMCIVPEQLDKKAFEKVASATTLPFVKYGEEPRVFIATDLAKALAVATVTAPAADVAAAASTSTDSDRGF